MTTTGYFTSSDFVRVLMLHILYVCVTTQQPMVSGLSRTGSLRQRHPPPKKISRWTRRQTSNKEVGDFILKREASTAGFSLKVLFLCAMHKSACVKRNWPKLLLLLSLSSRRQEGRIPSPPPTPSSIQNKVHSIDVYRFSAWFQKWKDAEPDTQGCSSCCLVSLCPLQQALSLSHIKQ